MSQTSIPVNEEAEEKEVAFLLPPTNDNDDEDDTVHFVPKFLDETINTAVTIAENRREDAKLIPNILEEAVDKAITISQKEAVSCVQSILSGILEVCNEKSSEEPSIKSEQIILLPSVQPSEESVVQEEEEVEEEEDLECKEYQELDVYAGQVVDRIIEEAAEIAIRLGASSTILQPEGLFGEEDISDSSASSVVEWPSIEKFNVDFGIEKIYEFMNTWYYEENWMYCVDFLIHLSDECSEFYKYEARWSIPTEMYPVPQATASIYFTIEVSRVKPSHCPVTMTYVYEGSSYVHSLESVFNEDRLFEIVDEKLTLFEQLTF